MARSLLGDNMYDDISSKSGIPGGEGHKFYEEWRELSPLDPRRPELEAKSKAYYDSVRKTMYGD